LKLFIKKLIYFYLIFIKFLNIGDGDWGLGIGDWGLGIGDWAQSPIPNPQSPIPNPHPQCLKVINNYKLFLKNK
jgi:hypothetical protein